MKSNRRNEEKNKRPPPSQVLGWQVVFPKNEPTATNLPHITRNEEFQFFLKQTFFGGVKLTTFFARALLKTSVAIHKHTPLRSTDISKSFSSSLLGCIPYTSPSMAADDRWETDPFDDGSSSTSFSPEYRPGKVCPLNIINTTFYASFGPLQPATELYPRPWHHFMALWIDLKAKELLKRNDTVLRNCKSPY